MSQLYQPQQWDPLNELQIYDPTKSGVLTCSATCTSEDKKGKRCGITLNRHLKRDGTATQEVNLMLAKLSTMHPLEAKTHESLAQLASVVLCELQPGELASGFEGHKKDQREERSPLEVLIGRWQDKIEARHGHVNFGGYYDEMDWAPTPPQQFMVSVEMPVYT